MSRLNSFYLEPESWPNAEGASVVLGGPEARHLVRVLRTRPGEIVRLFDGDGHHGLFKVVSTTKSTAELMAEEFLDVVHEAGPEIWIALGWNKSSRRGFLLEKAVELHASGLCFWQAEHSQGKVPTEVKPGWTDKFVQAAKQCGNPLLPRVRTVSGDVRGLIELAEEFDHVLVAWENEDTAALLGPESFGAGKTLIVIGPEGGFADNEVDALLDKGAVSVSLGSSVLRWETAALYCLGMAYFAREAGK